jgi:peptidoglycan/LPS O-acetylase OafA/YrhL
MATIKVRYFPALTGLRAWAIWLVILDHWVDGMHDYGMAGNAGVSLFFVLSGFLISRILLIEKQRVDLSKESSSFRKFLTPFLKRRAWRIFPIYVLALSVLLVTGDSVIRHQGIPFFTYTANFFLVTHPIAHLDHLWSLSVEEQLYILMPFLIWLTPSRQLPKLGLILIIISLFYRGSSHLLFPVAIWWPASYCLLPGCLDGYGIGLLVAWYWLYKPEKSQSFFNSSILLNSLFIAWPSVILAGLLWQLTGRGLFYSPGMAAGLRFMVSLYGGYLVGYCHQPLGVLGRLLLLNLVCQYIGRISYGLYLYHNLIFTIHAPQQSYGRQAWLRTADILHINSGNGLTEIVFYSVLLISIATLSWFIIEKPLLGHTHKKSVAINATLTTSMD